MDRLKLDDHVLNIPLFMADRADRLIGMVLKRTSYKYGVLKEKVYSRGDFVYNADEIRVYFYNETEDFEIASMELVETKYSYFDTVDCYHISTVQGVDFYVFTGDTTMTNLYPVRNDQTLDELYYMHVGFIAEYSSMAIRRNFILDFIKDTSVFPILDRRMSEISEELVPGKNASQLSGLANQIRDCYITLTDYLMNKLRTNNPEFKNDNFKDNLEEFLKIVLPGKQSEVRRNTINTIAQKGWKLNSELVHKDSVTVFDLLISFNILQLVVSSVSNVVVGNNMPLNKIKCPRCKGENHILQQNSEHADYEYVCESCGCIFEVSIDKLIKEF